MIIPFKTTNSALAVGNLSATNTVYDSTGNSSQWNSVYSLINTTSATTFNVANLSANNNINAYGNINLTGFNSKLYLGGNYLQGNGNSIIVGAFGMGFRAQGGLSNSFLMATDGVLGFGNDVSWWYTNNQRVGLTYDGPATFAQKDSSTSQTYRLYNIYTDVRNYERAAITFSAPNSAFTLSVESSGTGLNRDFWINTAGTTKVAVTSGGNVGIGITTPGQPLTIVGNVSSSATIYDGTGNSSNWNTAYSLVSGGIVSTISLPQSSNWQTTFNTVTALSGNWNSVYTFVNTATANTLNVNNLNVSGTLTATTLNLSSNYIYGQNTESVFTDGSNLYGNGGGTLTMNYTNGVYVNSSLYLSAANVPTKIYMYDSTGARWQLSITTAGALSTVKA